MNYSSRFARLVGQTIDFCIAALPVAAVGLLMAPMGRMGDAITSLAGLWTLGYLLLADGMEGGQSFGKRLLGMRVVDAKTGKPCSFGRSLLRNFTLTLLGPIDWVFIFGQRRQRLGDKLAGTVVIAAE